MNDPQDRPTPEWEARLWERLAAGDEQAVEDLYDQYAPHIYGLVFRVTGDRAAAEEITIEVLASTWADVRTFEPGTSLRAFLSMRAHELAAERMRNAG